MALDTLEQLKERLTDAELNEPQVGARRGSFSTSLKFISCNHMCGSVTSQKQLASVLGCLGFLAARSLSTLPW